MVILKIISVPVKKINQAPYNPRVDLQPGDAEYENLKRSIKEFGYIDPLIWNEKTGNLVGGHQRFKILVAEGYQELDVSVVNLEPPQEKAMNIALNKISGDWDEDALIAVLQELQDSDIELQLTGFDEVALKHMIGDIEIPNFEEGSEDDQGDLGVFTSKLITCPYCHEEFEHE